MNETITWIDANHDLPDADMDVLIRSTNESYPIWIGHHDSVRWVWCDGMQARHCEVTHWAEMPFGPEVSNG